MKICLKSSELKKNAYVRVYGRDVENWSEFVNYVSCVFGVCPTEDNTVGQLSQEKAIKEYKACSGGLNLYGLSIKPIKERVRGEIENGVICDKAEGGE
jgi:hypothetical protein